jgi:hypothetical protein
LKALADQDFSISIVRLKIKLDYPVLARVENMGCSSRTFEFSAIANQYAGAMAKRRLYGIRQFPLIWVSNSKRTEGCHRFSRPETGNERL